jgi:hypothetical protein
MHDLSRVRLPRRRLLKLAVVAAGLPALGLNAALAADEVWYQNFKDTTLYASAKSGAKKVLSIPQWTYLKAAGAQEGKRIPVAHPESGKQVYVDAEVVGLSGAPPPGWAFGGETAPTPTVAAAAAAPRATSSPEASKSGWVSNFAPAQLWSGPDSGAIFLGEADPGNFFKLVEAQRGDWLKVQDPLTAGFAYIDARAVGPVGGPPAVQRVPARWWGYIGGQGVNVRSEPWSDRASLGSLAQGTPVIVAAWVEGQEVLADQPGWAKLGEGVYVYGALLRKAKIEMPPPPPSHGSLGSRWIDVNLTQQTVTAYEGANPVYMTVTSGGRPGWETRQGIHEIIYRVERETMDSSTLLGQDAARADYKIENIRWTQYFTSDGQAIHENFWRDPALFGVPSSHGCLGMAAQEALWFWLWASTGTPVSVHF